MLENPWTPPDDYVFPFSSRTVSGVEKHNYVRKIHLDTHKDWLIFSDFKKGLFCKYCPWFTVRNEGGFQKNVPLKVLVTEPLTNYKDLTGSKGDLESHYATRYHKDAVVQGKEFLKNYYTPE